MKKLLLMTCLLISTSLFAQETHSPAYTCIDTNGNQKLLLMGNEFPQIEDLDWSHELKLATMDEYHTGTTPQMNHYNISKILYGSITTEQNEAGRTLVLDATTNNLRVLEGSKVVEYYDCTDF